jgi:hypothetical protein
VKLRFFPYDHFSLFSRHDSPELTQRLKQNVAPSKFFRFRRPDESYQGVVFENRFKISPVIGYRNSFLPVITGKFSRHHAGTKIQVSQRLHVVVTSFLILWCAVVLSIGGFISFSSLGASVNGAAEFEMFPLLMLLFAWVLTTGGFWWEARHTREELMIILEAAEDQPT